MKSNKMTVNDARQIGLGKLKVDRPLFDKCMEVAKGMEVRAEDLGAMTLALALMGASKADRSDKGLKNELMDALEIVSRAEKEWLMDQKRGHLH